MDKNKIKSYLSSNFLNEAKETADKPVGLKKTEDIQKANKSINAASLKDVAKDIKANDKALTANKTANTKEVKKRELDKKETETHENVELFQDTMLALDYDNPIDDLFKDRFEKSLAGHATMGNSNEYANVVQDKVWGGDPNFGQSLVDKTKAMSKVQQNVVGGGNTMLPYGVKNGNFAMNENNNMDKKDKMKRLVFKKPFNGLSNALNLIPESYRVDDKEFEMTDGNESYKVRWEGTLTEGRAIVLMGSSKEQVNEDIAKIKHLMGYSSEKTLGTLKGNQRLDENKRFADIWGKTKSLLTESEDIEDQDAPEGEWDEETKKAAEATKHVEGSVSKEKNFPNTPSVKTGEWDKAVKGQAAEAKKHIHMHESYMNVLGIEDSAEFPNDRLFILEQKIYEELNPNQNRLGFGIPAGPESSLQRHKLANHIASVLKEADVISVAGIDFINEKFIKEKNSVEDGEYAKTQGLKEEDKMNELTAAQDKFFNKVKTNDDKPFSDADFEALRNSKNLEEMEQGQVPNLNMAKDLTNKFFNSQVGQEKSVVYTLMQKLLDHFSKPGIQAKNKVKIAIDKLMTIVDAEDAKLDGTPENTSTTSTLGEGMYEEGVYEADRFAEIFEGMDEEDGINNDPTKEEMENFLKNEFNGYGLDDMEFDIAEAIYWFGYNYHGGQNSNLYSALSTSKYKPSPLMSNLEDDDSGEHEISKEMYDALVSKFAR